MNSIRVHTSDGCSRGKIGYMILKFSGSGRAVLNFDGLDLDFPSLSAEVALSPNAFYDLLMGKDLSLSNSAGTVILCPRGLELIIARKSSLGETLSESKVWLSELALGWNVLSGSGWSAA